ncbi:UNVERIFIED_CONTAM: hypothetical protein K2H54_057837 [Gekko kuhli]
MILRRPGTMRHYDSEETWRYVAEQLMTIAYDSGVNLFDTAEVYAAGKRSSLVITTKLYWGGKRDAWRQETPKARMTLHGTHPGRADAPPRTGGDFRAGSDEGSRQLRHQKTQPPTPPLTAAVTAPARNIPLLTRGCPR